MQQLFTESTNTKEQLEVLERYYSDKQPRLSNEQIILAIIDLNKERIKAYAAGLQFPCMSADGTRAITFASSRSMFTIYDEYSSKVEDLERIGNQDKDFVDAVTALRNEHEAKKKEAHANWEKVKWEHYPEETRRNKIDRLHEQAIIMDQSMKQNDIYAEALKNVPQKYIDAIRANA